MVQDRPDPADTASRAARDWCASAGPDIGLIGVFGGDTVKQPNQCGPGQVVGAFVGIVICGVAGELPGGTFGDFGVRQAQRAGGQRRDLDVAGLLEVSRRRQNGPRRDTYLADFKGSWYPELMAVESR